MRRWVIGALVALAAGAAYAQTDGLRSQLPSEANGDDTSCQSYGLKFGTKDYADCRLNLRMQRAEAERQNAEGEALQRAQAVQQQAQQQADRRAAALTALGIMQRGFQANAAQSQMMMQQGLQMMRPPQQRQPLNCTTSYIGQQAYTNCY